MPIIQSSTTGGEPVCTGDIKNDCSFSGLGGIVEQCSVCGEEPPCGCEISGSGEECSPCSTVGSDKVTEPILNRDACCLKGSASKAASTACNESFRGTVGVRTGFPLVKTAPGDKCLKHLYAEEEAFQISHPTCGSYLTRSPSVDVPLIQGYKTTVAGRMLTDVDGDPMLGEVPEFSDLWVSGLKSCPNRLFRLRAPKSDEPLSLVAEKGNYRFRTDGEKKLCSDILPDSTNSGRLLLIDRIADCDGETWCPKELRLDIEEDTCVNLIATQDDEGRTQIGTIVPSAAPGFLRSNPTAPCAPLNGDDLSDAELTQFRGFMDQALCDPVLPPKGESTVAVTRVAVCGTRTYGPEVTEGVQAVTVAELFALLEEEEPEQDAIVDVNGNPLVDGFAYDAVWNEADQRLVYKPAHRAVMLNNQVVAQYAAVNVIASGVEPYPVDLASHGIIVNQATHIEILIDLDVRFRSQSSNSQAYAYCEVGGMRLARAGQVDLGQVSFNSSDTGQSDNVTARLMVPITNGVITFKFGHVWSPQSGEANENEFYAKALLYAMHQFPLTI